MAEYADTKSFKSVWKNKKATSAIEYNITKEQAEFWFRKGQAFEQRLEKRRENEVLKGFK